jgi:hypothetical protein
MISASVTTAETISPKDIAAEILALAAILRRMDATLFAQTLGQLSMTNEEIVSSFDVSHPVWETFQAFLYEDREQERNSVDASIDAPESR